MDPAINICVFLSKKVPNLLEASPEGFKSIFDANTIIQALRYVEVGLQGVDLTTYQI